MLISGEKITLVKPFKDLEILFDTNLTFKPCVKKVTKKPQVKSHKSQVYKELYY